MVCGYDGDTGDTPICGDMGDMWIYIAVKVTCRYIGDMGDTWIRWGYGRCAAWLLDWPFPWDDTDVCPFPIIGARRIGRHLVLIINQANLWHRLHSSEVD